MPPAERKSSPRFFAYQAVARIEGENAYTDIVLSHILERSSLAERDRAFISELVRGVVRWKKLLDWIIDQLFTGKKSQLSPEARWLLWLGLYQIKFMEVPPFAAVNESVNLARALKQFRWTGLINALLRAFIRNPGTIKYPDATKSPVEFIAVTQSHPEWLVRRWLDLLGFDETLALCRANNKPPDLSVRSNPGKISPADLVAELEKNSVNYEPSPVPGFYRIKSIDFDLRTRWLNDGLITVQDDSAGLPGLLAGPKPGEIVADLCAAPGGKSTHLAELSAGQSRILSGDLNPARAGLVRQAAQRLGHTTIFPLVADAGFFSIKTADVVLLDAPCSGLGVMRKKPDLRWKKQSQDIQQLADQQAFLLDRAAGLVKNGGSLIYSTCTIDPAENEEIVRAFLRDHPEFELASAAEVVSKEFVTADGFVRTWPHKHYMDGSFAAKLIKRDREC